MRCWVRYASTGTRSIRPDEREIRLLSALARQAAIDGQQRPLPELRSPPHAGRPQGRPGHPGCAAPPCERVGSRPAGASHHLNNLMAVVLGRTQLLLMKKPPEAMMASLKTIERGAVDAAETVRRIQAFGRTDTRDAGGGLRSQRHRARGHTAHAPALVGTRPSPRCSRRGDPLPGDARCACPGAPPRSGKW